MRESKYIDLVKFASQHLRSQGEVPLAAMTRLAEATHCTELKGVVKYDLVGNVDWEGIPFIEGHFTSAIPLICQRCMSLFDYKIDTRTKLSPVKTEQQAENLPSDYDAVIVTEEEISLVELIEDELLLNVPTVAKHEAGECKVKENHWSYGEEVKVTKSAANNPFAELADLKKSFKKEE